MIASADNLLVSSLLKLLNSNTGHLVLNSSNSGEEILSQYNMHLPDLILLDIKLIDINGFELLEKIKEKNDKVKVLLITYFENKLEMEKARSLGASGIISRSSTFENLLDAIYQISINESYFFTPNNDYENSNNSNEYSNYFHSSNGSLNNSFTERELEILDLLGDGLSSIEISNKLKISKRTVDVHRSNLIQKLNFSSSNQLIKFAVERKLLSAV